jgi:signal transduction histidine kinase
MDRLFAVLQWFAGGSDHPYMRLWHCMSMDLLWVSITIFLDLSIACGYILIASHWLRNERLLPDSPSKRAMAAMKNIFIFCGLCGYAFIPIKMFWPAWRLYDIFLAALAFYTWRYAWGAKDLKVVYNELGRTSELAKQLEASKAEVQRRSDFLNAVSHDLRTPLNGMTLRTNLAEMQLSLGDRDGLEKSLTEIRASASAVGEMLDVLLDYARIDRDHAAPASDVFNLRDLVTEVLRDVSPDAEMKKLRVSQDLPGDLTITTDRLKLRRVLSNLVGNAVKFTPAGSVSVHAEMGRAPLNDDPANSAGVEIHVLDTGVGIPPDRLDKIFEEFYQVENYQRDHRKGFGMGLPIARQLVTRLGGEIQVQSTPGKGSRFTIILPNACYEHRNPKADIPSIEPTPSDRQPIGGNDIQTAR